MLLKIILLALIVIYIIDISGIVPSIKKRILERAFHLSNPDPYKVSWKPFDCSRCMTFWSGIVFLLVTGNFTIPYLAFVSLLSMLSYQISGFLQLVCDAISTLISNIERKLVD